MSRIGPGVLLIAVVAGCATAKPPPPAPQPEERAVDTQALHLLARPDEPAKVLLDFESDRELALVKANNLELAVGPQGATHGKQALRVTATQEEEGHTSVRLAVDPEGALAGFQELVFDATDLGSQPQTLGVALATRTGTANDEPNRRKGTVQLPPGETVTVRLVLSGEARRDAKGPNATGLWAKSNGVDVDLSAVKYIFLSLAHAKAGEQVAFDAVRLVKRNAEGVAIAPVKKPKLAVMDLQALSGDLKARAKVLTALVFDEAVAEKGAEVIGSDEIRQMLSVERQKQLLGCGDGECLAQIAGSIGSDFVLTGQVGKLGSRTRVDVRLLDVTHAKVVASDGEFVPAGNDDALADATTRVVKKVLAASPLKPGT